MLSLAKARKDYYLRKQAGLVSGLSTLMANRLMYGRAGTPLLSAASAAATEFAPDTLEPRFTPLRPRQRRKRRRRR